MIKNKRYLIISALILIIIGTAITLIFLNQASANKDLEIELLQNETDSLFVSEQREDLRPDFSKENLVSIQESAGLIEESRLNNDQAARLTNIMTSTKEAQSMYEIITRVDKLFNKKVLKEDVVLDDLKEIKKIIESDSLLNDFFIEKIKKQIKIVKIN